MKICDLTQFYSPLSGGVKRYVHEKIRFIQNSSSGDEHVLIVPGEKTEVIEAERSRIYAIHSPLLSRTTRYRALVNLRAVEQILERERPDIMESGDPYQMAWKAIAAGRALGIPAVAFYHSHFPEAYLRSTARRFGKTATEIVMHASRRYVRRLYNQFEATLVPSTHLSDVLQSWGVQNVRAVNLGVNTEIFRPLPDEAEATKNSLGILSRAKVLLYVGRLAPEKNTATLFGAIALLEQRRPGDFHLVVIGDGAQRNLVRELIKAGAHLTWIQYCTDSAELARFYRAADLFIHPGVQETFGLVALESQACGTPVVGIRGSYMDRIIFHAQDFWARENSPEALADAIEGSMEKDLVALGAAAAREAAERYRWPTIFERLFGIYREVCAGYRKR